MNPDPRAQKYIDFFEENTIAYVVLGWDRSGTAVSKDNYIFFKLRAKYGMRYLNIKNKLLWILFVLKYLLMHKKEYSVVHACDFDAALPTYIASIITKKKFIFDVFDSVNDESKKDTISTILGFVEKKIALKANHIIMCEEERKEQIATKRQDILIMPNIPSVIIHTNSDIQSIVNKQRADYSLIISYVGVFDVNRGIEDLLEVVSKDTGILLNIAGFGLLEDKVIEYSKKFNNVIFWGRVDYNKGLNIMGNSDLIFAMYYLKNPLHRHAAPNKYYEGLMLGVPIITTKGTLVGNNTERYSTGFAIEEGKEQISKLFSRNDLMGELKSKKERSKYIWKNQFKNYIKNFMTNIYKDII